MKYLYFLMLSSFLISSCSSSKDIQPLTETFEENKTTEVKDVINNNASPLITMKKGVCFGQCKVYNLTIFEDGQMEFEGFSNVNRMGVFSKGITKLDLKKLKTAFKKADFKSFEEYYPSDIPDLASVEIGFATGKVLKTVTGKRERPQGLKNLQILLEEIAENEEGWVQSDENAQMLENIDKSKILIVFKPGTQISTWFNNARESHGIRIRKQSAVKDGWIISYNNQLNNSSEILEILQNDEELVSAEFVKN